MCRVSAHPIGSNVMAKNHLYTVAHTGQRLLDDYRGDRIYSDVYQVIKYDKTLLSEEGFYTIISSTLGEWCDCPAAHRNLPRSTYKKKGHSNGYLRMQKPAKECRHMALFHLFKEQDKVGSGELYDYDIGAWTNKKGDL
jgi:hypothetical protein